MSKIESRVEKLNEIDLPLYTGEVSMVKFCLNTLDGLPLEFHNIARDMLKNVTAGGEGYFTIHGRQLAKGETLRRPGPHTDGNYEPCSWGKGGGNGWKVGENGPAVDTEYHRDSYLNVNGGIILASNYEACDGWIGEFEGKIGVGGDCSTFDLSSGKIELEKNTVYYGNNHFIHESLPMSDDVHRVLVRITLPMTHNYLGGM